MDHITIQGNRLSGMTLSITMEDLDGGVRRDWKVLDNTGDLLRAGPRAPPCGSSGSSGLTVSGNIQPMKPDRDMYGVGVTYSCTVSVSGNSFPNGVGQLKSTGTC